jgi:hypothetical protein
MKYIYRRSSICILNLILLAQPSAVLGQARSGSLHGTITDIYGALIPRAKITATLKGATDAGNLRLFQVVTDDEGKFLLENLPPGVYEVRVSTESSEAQAERVVPVPGGKSVELMVQVGHGCDRISEGSGVVSEEDKAEVIRMTFSQAVNPKMGLLMQEQRSNGVILSTKNIKPEWVQGLQGVRVRLMSQSRIQQKADREGDFLYMSFSEVRVRGMCIAVTVANTWAVGKRSGMGYLSGGGYTYEYRKESGRWVGKYVSGWIS